MKRTTRQPILVDQYQWKLMVNLNRRIFHLLTSQDVDLTLVKLQEGKIWAFAIQTENFEEQSSNHSRGLQKNS